MDIRSNSGYVDYPNCLTHHQSPLTDPLCHARFKCQSTDELEGHVDTLLDFLSSLPTWIEAEFRT
jgi:hypothetical protein